MATVKLTDVKKIYPNGVTAVHDFNLDIADKEFIVFVGPSGCGKSTTLRMVAGLEDITEGTVEIDGVVVNDLQPKDRNIAMVFQNYALYPHLTVFENMAFPLRIQKQDVKYEDENRIYNKQIATYEETLQSAKTDKQKESIKNKIEELKKQIAENEKKIAQGEESHFVKMSNDMIYERVTAAAEILNITEYLTRKPRALSGGQRQRVAIGRAMVRHSKVFLMDEPLSNLDAKLRNQMRAEIILLRKRINTTFIYVTHDQTEAMTLGDRIVIMKDGFIQQVGTPNEVFDMPKNLFVAEFIGAPKMNTFETDLIVEDGKYYVTPFGAKILVDGSKAEMLKNKNISAQKIILGARPEHMVLAKEKTASTIEVTLLVNEMMGSELHLHVQTEDGTKMIVRVQTIGLDDEQKRSLVAGATLYVTFEGKVMHFFDKESTNNLLVE